MAVEYREEPCRSALNRVQGMGFNWSLNPYMGCVHRCTYCYVRAYERRADRPADERYGTSIRVKMNIADVLRASWRGVRGRASRWRSARRPIRYQPAEGKYRLTRAMPRGAGGRTQSVQHHHARHRWSCATSTCCRRRRGARRSTLRSRFPRWTRDVWRKTEPGTAPPRQRLRALRVLVDAGIDAGVGIAPVLARPHRHDPSCWPRSRVPRATPAPRASGATCSSCSPARASTSWSHSRAIGRSSCARYERLYATPYLPARETEPIKERVAALRARVGIADRRRVKLEPPPTPEQLRLM